MAVTGCAGVACTGGVDFVEVRKEPLSGLQRGFEREIELNDLSLLQQEPCQTRGRNKFNGLGWSALSTVHKADKLCSTSYHFLTLAAEEGGFKTAVSRQAESVVDFPRPYSGQSST